MWLPPLLWANGQSAFVYISSVYFHISFANVFECFLSDTLHIIRSMLPRPQTQKCRWQSQGVIFVRSRKEGRGADKGPGGR